jgi:DNA-binding CsgD family transcriptional regulator
LAVVGNPTSACVFGVGIAAVMSTVHGVFCLACGENCCLHMMGSRQFMLTRVQVKILQALARPDLRTYKEIAYELGITYGTVKVYVSKIYHKLGWPGGSDRELLLWAIAHRQKLGIELPSGPTSSFADCMKKPPIHTATKKAPKLHAFLAAIAAVPSVTRAAQAAGIHRSFHYSRYESDPVYKAAFDRAWEMGIAACEDDAVEKAMIGYDEPVIYQGQLQYEVVRDEKGEVVMNGDKPAFRPLIIRRPNPGLQQFILRGAKPEKYRERYQHDVRGAVGLKFAGSLEELLATYRDLTKAEEAQPA